MKLLAEQGLACAESQDGALTNLDCKVIECDEIWSFSYAKQKNVPEQFQGTPGYGDVWTCVRVHDIPSLVVHGIPHWAPV